MIEQLWAAEPGQLKIYLEKIENATPDEIKLANEHGLEQTAAEILSIAGTEALIDITGILTPNGPSFIAQLFGLGGTGFKQIREAIFEIEGNEDIKTVRLRMDTPGGTFRGTDETFQAIARLSKSRKVIAENHGMVASAGYWLAVGANEIVAMSPSAETGSIGVIVVDFDFSEKLKEEGIKKVVIRSQNAQKKAPGVSTKAEINQIQERLNAIERIFISRIAVGRAVSEETVRKEFGQGAVFVAQDPEKGKPDAVTVGMIDRVISPIGTNVIVNKNKTQKTESRGGNTMNLTELFAEHPSAQAEFSVLCTEQFDKGVAKTEEAVKARIVRATPILESMDYPQALKTLAVQVVTGEVGADALDAAVASFDATKEEAAAAAAQKETEENKETPPAALDQKSTDGGIRSEADLMAAAAKMRGESEEEVN